MRTLSRYVLRRTSASFLLLLLVFLGVIAGGQLALALGRGVPPDALGSSLLGMCLLALPIALPLALTTAVLVTMGAMQRDGELRALASAGIAEYSVAARLAPLVIAGVLISAALSHLILPQAVISLRKNMGRFAQAALAYQVAAQDSLFSQNGVRVYARSALGKHLSDIYLMAREPDAETTVCALGADWFLGHSGTGEGLGLELHDVVLARRFDDGRVTVGETPNMQYSVPSRGSIAVAAQEADTWSTPRLVSTIRDWTPRQSRSLLNNARLTLQLRLFLPVGVAIFAIFAAGLALALGTADLLFGVLLVVLMVATATLPAIQYVKTSVDHPQIDPGWLLWPPGLLLLLLGLWMLMRPLQAREWLGLPLQALGRWARYVLVAARGLYAYLARRRHAIDRLAERAAPVTRLVPRGLSTLDRHVLSGTVTRWLVVLLMGTFLVALGEFIGKNSLYVRSLSAQPLVVVRYFLYRMPEFASLWLPASVAVAALLMAAPMLRQGSLVALSAAGIAPGRVFVALLPFALLVGGAGFLLDDQIIPRLRPLADRAEELLEQSATASRPGRTTAPSAGWRAGKAFWCARGALPNLGVFNRVTAFTGAPGSMTVVMAERMDWRDGAWRLHNVAVAGVAGLRQVAEATPAELGVPLIRSPAELALDLRPEQNKTSFQLLSARTSRTWRVIMARMIWTLAPLLCLAGALPLFTRWESRYRLGAVGAQAVVTLVLGVASVTVVTRLLTSTAQNPFLIAGTAAIAIMAAALWRWRGLRV